MRILSIGSSGAVNNKGCYAKHNNCTHGEVALFSQNELHHFANNVIRLDVAM